MPEDIPSPMAIFYRSNDYTGPLPDASEIESSCKLFVQGGATVARISPHTVVKYGSRVDKIEAETLLFVGKYAKSIPVPRVHACYRIGPLSRDPADFGSTYNTYIIMDYIKGDRLDKVWNDLSEEYKASIASDLRRHLRKLRSIPRDGDAFIGSVMRGALLDPVFEYIDIQGPFACEDDFNAALVSSHEKNMPKANLRHHLEGALARHKHEVVFTHGDLRPNNIIVQDQRIVGIVDWEMSGWYPAYWDFAKCFGVWGWAKDWPCFVSAAMEPWWCEWAIYDLITRHMW